MINSKPLDLNSVGIKLVNNFVLSGNWTVLLIDLNTNGVLFKIFIIRQPPNPLKIAFASKIYS
jgi:hypothetical protein